jgi:hypothetical protein
LTASHFIQKSKHTGLERVSANKRYDTCRRHIFIVRATVPDAAEREAFDAWYSREHLPDAVKSFGCNKAWRFWSAVDPSQHLAMYEFNDRETLDRATNGEAMKRLSCDFDRDWPSIKRARDILVQSEEFGG